MSTSNGAGVLVGAGPVGLAAARALAEDRLVSHIAAVVDPLESARTKAGQDFGDAELVDKIEDLREAEPGAVAIVAFSSRPGPTANAISALLTRGYSVVTTCEELADPATPDAERLRVQAETDGRVVLVTGANPGFVMDRVPILLASGVRNVTAIRVTRRLDTRSRRGPLIEKTGYGLSKDAFKAGVAEGRLGHAGLEASARIVARFLGIDTDRLSTTIEPVLGADGSVLGLHQVAAVRDEGREVLLDLTMEWGAETPGDVVSIEGSPPLTVTLEGGYHGDVGTTARVVTAVRAIPLLAPGLYTPGDAPLIA